MTETKRVRIAVAVDPSGMFTAFAMDSHERDPRNPLLEQSLLDGMEGERISIVEADVPMPEEPAVVRVEVVDG